MAELEAKFEDTNYIDVSTAAGGHALGRSIEGDGVLRDFIDDDPEWNDLFRKARVSSIKRGENGFNFEPYGPRIHNGSRVDVRFIHSPGDDYSEISCLPEYASLECGLCVVTLEKDWWLSYTWYPDEILEAEYKELLAGEIEEVVYREMANEAYAACWAESQKIIGFDY